MKNFQKEPMPKKKSHPIADQFSDDEMDQIKHSIMPQSNTAWFEIVIIQKSFSCL